MEASHFVPFLYIFFPVPFRRELDRDNRPAGKSLSGWIIADLVTGQLAQDTRARLGLGGIAVKDGEKRVPHLAGLLASVNGLPDARLLVVVHNGGSLLVVGLKALLEGVGVVVGALDERLAGDVVDHGHLGRVEGGVVGAARCWVDQATRDARDQQGVVDLQLHSVLQGLVALLEHCVETLSLGNGTRETVEDESARMEKRVRSTGQRDVELAG